MRSVSAMAGRKAVAVRRRWAARWSVGVADSPEIGTSGRERATTRLLQFSDGVFTIAATILVLEIQRPLDAAHLSRGLLELWPSYRCCLLWRVVRPGIGLLLPHLEARAGTPPPGRDHRRADRENAAPPFPARGP